MTRSPLPAATLALLLPLVWLALGVALGQDDPALHGEGGPVELFSAMYLLLAGTMLLILPDRAARWHQAVLLAASCARWTGTSASPSTASCRCAMTPERRRCPKRSSARWSR
ncbi:hypothetical protein KY389_09040 [Paracoccus bogoriensis]|uniref:hypothetical protein n=1 Tax=Paracoccus bogoriensis TaxID=242065 RepID=UPI001CA4958D|nr:hypothetical protein [Paracoccus bogoriensis]MBW7056838.1 hypothetical protein [Paracoccus bogoriensis]